MNTLLTAEKSLPTHARITSRRREHLFYTGMAVAIVGTVFAGFAPTYYLRPLFDTPPLMPLLHLHGIVFTSWVVLFLTQNMLVAAGRTDVHRRLGVVGAMIALSLIHI